MYYWFCVNFISCKHDLYPWKSCANNLRKTARIFPISENIRRNMITEFFKKTKENHKLESCKEPERLFNKSVSLKCRKVSFVAELSSGHLVCATVGQCRLLNSSFKN